MRKWLGSLTPKTLFFSVTAPLVFILAVWIGVCTSMGVREDPEAFKASDVIATRREAALRCIAERDAGFPIQPHRTFAPHAKAEHVRAPTPSPLPDCITVISTGEPSPQP